MHDRLILLAKNRKFLLCSIVCLVIIALGVVGPLLVGSPTDFVGKAYEHPSFKFLLGTDNLGRDVFAQLLTGLRNSLWVGLLVGLMAISIGILLGGLGGYKGGLTDEGANVFTNIFLILPQIPIFIVVAALLEERSLVTVALIIGFFSWPWVARCVRSQILSLKERDFVKIARVSGKGDFTILAKEILPNMLAYVFMSLVIVIGGAIVAEAGISVLGLGPSRGTTLGMVLYQAIKYGAITRGAWWWFVPPGVIITLFTGTLIMISSVIDDVLNPKVREM